MKKMTPVLIMDEIEPSLAFWVDRLGFEQTVAVPHGDKLGFVILQRGHLELMLQTRASVADDVQALATAVTGPAALFVEVDDLDAIERALEGIEPVTPRRITFYGADELIVQEPGGNFVTFAHFGEGG